MARAFCSEISSHSGEPLGATASRIDHWLLLEYRGVWARDAVAGSGLSAAVKSHLRATLAVLPRSRLLFVRRTERRRPPRLALFYGTSRERGSRFFELELDSYEELVELPLAEAFGGTPLGARLAHPLFLVCTHGKHDRCCARYGRPLYEALREQAESDWVWQSSHVGGDRFAGNLVCLPEGFYFGRVGRDEVWPLLDEYLAGRIDLPRYRGRSCYSFAVQAAERALRGELDLRGFDDLTFLGNQQSADGALVRFRDAAGETREVEVTAELGELTYLTCSSESLAHPRRFSVRRVS